MHYAYSIYADTKLQTNTHLPIKTKILAAKPFNEK